MGKTCAICGKPSGMYPLCKDCFKLKDEGKVVKCEECGTWYLADEGCPNCKPAKETPKTKKSSPPRLTCLTCDNPTMYDKHFCFPCYTKFKDRAIDIRITHCTETEILDQYGNRTYKCDDGRTVRSLSEQAIANWLFKENIRSVYEEEVYYTENGEQKTLHPDFYLPDFKTYIEYNGLSNASYLKSKEYTQKIYKELGKEVIILTQKDLENLSACLKPKLGLH